MKTSTGGHQIKEYTGKSKDETGTRSKEVATGHHNILKVISCAQKHFATHSEPSKQSHVLAWHGKVQIIDQTRYLLHMKSLLPERYLVTTVVGLGIETWANMPQTDMTVFLVLVDSTPRSVQVLTMSSKRGSSRTHGEHHGVTMDGD